MATLYLKYPATGSVSELETSAAEDEDVPLPEGAELISAEEYAQALAAIQEANARLVAEQEQQINAAAKEDYEALLAQGIPEATARRLSGYIPPEGGGGHLTGEK